MAELSIKSVFDTLQEAKRTQSWAIVSEVIHLLAVYLNNAAPTTSDEGKVNNLYTADFLHQKINTLASLANPAPARTELDNECMTLLCLSSIYPSTLRTVKSSSWDSGWETWLLVELPSGQEEFHISEDDLRYFTHLSTEIKNQ